MSIVLFVIGIVVGFLAWTALLGVLVIRLPIMNRYYTHTTKSKVVMAVALWPALFIAALLIIPSLFWAPYLYGQFAGLLLNFFNWKNIVTENHKSLLESEPRMKDFIKK